MRHVRGIKEGGILILRWMLGSEKGESRILGDWNSKACLSGSESSERRRSRKRQGRGWNVGDHALGLGGDPTSASLRIAVDPGPLFS